MAFKMTGSKFYGDRSRKEMRQDIRAERRTLKEGGATREEVKTFNQNQRGRKEDIREDVKAAKKESREHNKSARKTEGTRLAQTVRRAVSGIRAKGSED